MWRCILIFFKWALLEESSFLTLSIPCDMRLKANICVMLRFRVNKREIVSLLDCIYSVKHSENQWVLIKEYAGSMGGLHLICWMRLMSWSRPYFVKLTLKWLYIINVKGNSCNWGSYKMVETQCSSISRHFN